MRLNNTEEFVIADIPGLSEGASEGAGLGDRFLGHVERCATLIHLIDGTESQIVKHWRLIRNELEAYDPGLASKPEVIVLNKCDALTPTQKTAKKRALAKASGADVMLLSGVTHEGLPELLR